MNKKIYLDNAATTPVAKEVLEEMLPCFSEKYGNSSSLHSFGRDAQDVIERARERVADFLSCQKDEIIFTGSATEANNIFIQGVLRGVENPHVITSAVEHDAVLQTVKNSGADLTILSVDKEGFVNPEDVLKEIKEDTVLVSIMYANNEVGTIQPIKEIGKLIKKENKRRERKILFHTDAVQAIGYLSADVEELGVDGLTLSGHKIYGPKGIGVLYKRNDLKLEPLFFGGGQERELRPGTLNTPLIVAIGKAVELLKSVNRKEETEKLRDCLIKEVLKIEGASLNGPKAGRLSNNANFSFTGVEGESLVMLLDQKGIATSTGSACSSKTLEASHVLKAMGLPDLEAHSSLRVSLGRSTEKKDIDEFLIELKEAIKRLRDISGR
ncbi:MAG: cysteine desulfurase family protein [Patescibacteria group bacterium]